MIVIALSMSAGCSDDGGGEPPNRTFISRSSATDWESEAWLAASRDGTKLVAAWTGRTVDDWLGEGPIGYTMSSDGGDTWQPPRTLAFPDRETPFNVKVAIDAAGDAWAVWLARSTSGPSDAIVVARAANDGGFGAPVEVTALAPDDEGVDLPTITTHRGAALAAYTIYRERCMATEVARSTDGVTWTRVAVAPCEPASPVKNLNALCASETSDRIWLANTAGDPEAGGKLRVELRHSDDGGRSWSAARVISRDDEPIAFDPIACAMHGDDLWLAYGLTHGPIQPGLFSKLHSVQVARVANDGGVTHIEALDGEFAMHPQLATADDGGVYAFYLAGTRDDDPAGSLRRSELVGDAFAPSEVVDAPLVFNEQWGERDFLGDYFGVAIAGGSVLTAHAAASRDGVHIAFTKQAR